jgi:hypothetical protein
VALPSVEYTPRDPGGSVLQQIVREHFETFRAEAAHLRDGEGLPRFVEQEFRNFLTCGCLAGGFARFHCACGFDRLVPFSCKSRAICASCGGRRMAERAAHLLDHVFPDVPIRQWVLSLPYRLRYQLAWDHDLCRAVAGVALRAVLGWLRRRARLDGVRDGRGGAVVVIQRFGGSANCNVHLHALALDGVFAKRETGGLVFHPASPVTDLDVAEVLATIEPGILRLLDRRGRGADDEAVDPLAEESPVLAGLAAASVQGRVALGGTRGARVSRLGNREDPGEEEEEPFSAARGHARSNGFDLHAGRVVPAGQRGQLEQVCAYVLRPTVAQERLSVTPGGQVLLRFRQPWRDGTTHLVFDPVEFLGRLAVLIPRPRINLILYHGVLAPRAAWRSAIVPSLAVPGGEVTARVADATPADAEAVARRRARGQTWAALMARTFGLDVLACPRCGGRLRLVALIEQRAVIDRILRHLGLPTETPAPRPARAPPTGRGRSDAPRGDEDLPVIDVVH